MYVWYVCLFVQVLVIGKPSQRAYLCIMPFKYVLAVIPTYALSCFKLRDSQYRDFTSLFLNYQWGQIKEKRKMHFEDIFLKEENWVHWMHSMFSRKSFPQVPEVNEIHPSNVKRSYSPVYQYLKNHDVS